MKMTFLLGALFVSQITLANNKQTVPQAKNNMKLFCQVDYNGDLCRLKIDSLSESATCEEISLFLKSIGLKTVDSNGNDAPVSDTIFCVN